MWPQLYAGSHHHISADMSPIADFSGRIDDGSRVDSGGIGGRLVEEAQRARKSQIGVLDPQRAASISWNSGSTSTAAARVFAGKPSVPGIGNEGDLRWPGLLNPFYACDFNLCASVQFRAQVCLPVRLISLNEIVKE